MKNTLHHTPAPWEISKHATPEHSPQYGIHIGDNDFVIVKGDNAAADALLIAASPDLLEALQNALNVLAGIATGDLKTIERNSPAILKARLAIKKAKGEA